MIQRQDREREPAACESCGGRLERKNPYVYRCTSCGREYYISADRTHRVSVRISAGRIILICALAVIVITGAAVAGYQFYTGHLVASASRFSVVFRDFLMEACEKPAADISQEDLDQIKYLKIERDKEYKFTYSYADYYDYPDPAEHGKTRRTITIKAPQDDFSPTDVQYFTGLTRLELYTGAWENYALPEENVLRSIYCVDGLSKYGTPQFFDRVNPDTLEEVAILEAEELKDFSFMEKLKGIKVLLLDKAELETGQILAGFENLERLYLYYPAMEEEKAEAIVEEMLALPGLQYFYIEGKAAWYIPDEQWEKWKEDYQDRVFLERK